MFMKITTFLLLLWSKDKVKYLIRDDYMFRNKEIAVNFFGYFL